jgi:DNA-directed RNA polymerase specialized sigma24 family protein
MEGHEVSQLEKGESTMEESLFAQVSPFIRLALEYVATKFGVAEEIASDVVQSVLAGLLWKRGEKLTNPKRYLLRSCRWKALRSLRGRQRPPGPGRTGATPKAPEILVALEEKDRERFFGPPAASQRHAFELIGHTHGPLDVSASLEVPGSIVRVRFSLAATNLDQKAS